MAYSGDACVGYFGILPGRLKIATRLHKVYWGTTWYANPVYRGGSTASDPFRTCSRAGAASVISADPDELYAASKLILPGVGHFKYAMDALRERNLVDVIQELAVTARKPLLGIGLRAQLLGRRSEEGNCDGLGLVPMDIVGFDRARMDGHAKVPHMGWALTRQEGSSPLFRWMEASPRFYYVHSYHFQCDDSDMVMCTAEHG